MIFLPARPRRTPLALAGPLCCGLAAAAVALVGVWGLARAGRAVPVELPRLPASEPLDGNFAGHTVAIRRDGGFALGGARLSAAELGARLRRLGSLPGGARQQVAIRADAGAPFARVAELLELCRSAGLGAVRFEVLEESAP